VSRLAFRLEERLPRVRRGIDDADDCAIGRRIFSLEGEAGFLAPAPKNQFTNTRADRVDSYERFSRGLEILVQRLDNKQLSSVK